MRAKRSADHRLSRRLSVDLGKQRFHGARRRRAEGLIEMDGLSEFVTHQFVAAGEFGIFSERGFDTPHIAAAQRACRMPR